MRTLVFRRDKNLNFEAGRLFGKFDQSQTGKLGKEEFQNLFAHLSQQQQQQRSSAVARGGNSAFDLGLMFSKYDTDGSGKLNSAKFRALMQNLPNHKPASAQPVPYSHETNGFARPFQTPLLAKKQTADDHILQLRMRMQVR